MAEEIQISGKIYISSKRAAEIVGYAQDYIGQLARGGSIDAERVGGLWYINKESITEHKKKADEYIPVPPKRHIPQELESIISFEGKEYISAARASEITGYHKDYVGQLARTKQVPSQQVGNRWYVDRKALERHKEEKDALLAAVQAQAVGLKKSSEIALKAPYTKESGDTYFKYSSEEEKPLIPLIPKRENASVREEQQKEVLEEQLEVRIPINVYSRATKNVSLAAVPAQNKNNNVEVVPVVSGTAKYARFTVLIIALITITFGGVYTIRGVLTDVKFSLNSDSGITKTSQQSVALSAVTITDSVVGFIERLLTPEVEYKSKR